MATTIHYLFRESNIHDLSKEEKIELMSILISVLIGTADPRQKSRIHPKKLSEIVQIESGGGIIDIDLMPDDPTLIKTLAPLLIKKKDGSNIETHEAGKIIRAALNNFPDKTLSDGTSTVLLKSKFIKDSFPEILKEDRGLVQAATYVELLPTLTSQKLRVNISLKEYEQASKESNYSDYIVLSIGMLKSLLKGVKDIKLRGKDQIIFNKLLNGEIEKDYFELNYEDCMNKIIDCARALKRNLNKQGTEEGFKIDKVCEKIIQARKKCSEVNPDKNDTRRYYVTKVSQYLLGSMGTGDKINSINHILQALLKRKADSVQALEEDISSLESLSATEEIWRRRDELKLDSPIFRARHKVKKPGFEDRMLTVESIFTMNLGAMKSFEPNFRDEITLHPLRNRIVDTHSLPWKKTNRRIDRTAYIADISGHAFCMVAILEKYMKANPGPTLEKDINNFLQAFVAIHTKRGFHDLHEVLDVLREPNVVKVFKDCGVNINLSIHPSVLQKAMNDTLAYSKTVSLKKSMFIEITEKAWIMMSDLAFKKEMQCLKEELENPELIQEISENPRRIDSINRIKIILQNVIKRRPDEALLINELLDIIERIYFQINFYDIMQKEDLEKLRDFIAKPNTLKYIDTPTMHAVTLIHYAAGSGSLEIVKKLIEMGANLKVGDSLGRTPLVVAAINDNDEVVTLLGEKATQEEKNIALVSAVKVGSKDSVLALLKKGANINFHKEPSGETPLILAIQKSEAEVFRALLNANPSLIKTDALGFTALHYALLKKRDLMAQEILNAVLDLRDLEFILNAGPSGKKPLDIVRDLKDPTLIKIIEEAHKRLEEWKKIARSKDKSEQYTVIDLKEITEDQETMDASEKASSVTFQYDSLSGEGGKVTVVPTAPKPPSATG